MKIELLLDAVEFWARLKADLLAATESAFIQTFTFEGDRVGAGLARAFRSCRAADRRLLIDRYSLIYHSDRVIPGPAWLRADFRREFMLTRRSIRRLRSEGVGVRFSNPLGPSPAMLVRRNHKKIAVLDRRVAYIGGINFSDHNFAWHDMMFRVECEDLARLLAEDFSASWDGTPCASDRSCGPLRILSLNGRSNQAVIWPVLAAIGAARRSVDVVSAYLSYPFTKHLAQAAARGVRVRVLTPGANNKPNFARHILEAARKSGFEVHRYRGGMSHMKAMLIDEELLIAGSSNFDYLSFNVLEELVVMTRAPDLVTTFSERVWKPDMMAALPATRVSSFGTRWGNAAVRTCAALASTLALE
jgi:cardiolipin synthase